jgi:hypothetical protein
MDDEEKEEERMKRKLRVGLNVETKCGERSSRKKQGKLKEYRRRSIEQ